jgi:hypothetical protein
VITIRRSSCDRFGSNTRLFGRRDGTKIPRSGFGEVVGSAGLVLMFDIGNRQMPIRLPQAEVIRRSIAEKAAEASAATVDHYLDLLGPVEPAFKAIDGHEASWRLTYYQGSPDEHDAIERAVGMVQRLNPLMRVN